jgi:hypothetical protein
MLEKLFDFSWDIRLEPSDWSDTVTSDERMTAGQCLKQKDRVEIVMEILEVFTQLRHERVGDDVDLFDFIRLLQRD